MNIIHKPRHRWSFEILQKSSASGQTFIVKRIPISASPLLRPVMRQLLKKEACILKEIESKIHGIAPNLCYIDKDEFAMEKLTGPNLWQARHTLKQRQDIFKKLEYVIYKLHGCGIGHGEIRLGNILFNGSDIILVDFTMALSRNNPFFKIIKKLDLLSLLWIKKHIFNLQLTPDEIALSKRHFLVKSFFNFFIAKDIIYP